MNCGHERGHRRERSHSLDNAKRAHNSRNNPGARFLKRPPVETHSAKDEEKAHGEQTLQDRIVSEVTRTAKSQETNVFWLVDSIVSLGEPLGQRVRDGPGRESADQRADQGRDTSDESDAADRQVVWWRTKDLSVDGGGKR